jgi:hypothetical protein
VGDSQEALIPGRLVRVAADENSLRRREATHGNKRKPETA